MKNRLSTTLLLLFATIVVSACGGGSSGAGSGGSSGGGSTSRDLQVSMSSIEYGTFGYPMFAIARNDGNILVSVSNVGGSAMAAAQSGIQIFSKNQQSGVLSNPCSNQSLNFFQMDTSSTVNQIFGLKPYPGYANSLGMAVEKAGADFYTIPNITDCTVLMRPTNVAQPPFDPVGNRSAFDLVFTSDGRNAFVANEYGSALGGSGTIGVLNVVRNTAGDFTGTTFIPNNFYLEVPGGQAIPGITLSHDGKRLYITAEVALNAAYQNPTKSSNPTLVNNKCSNGSINGLLTVIDVQKAVAGQGTSQSAIQTIAAGCSPVRVVETSDGKTIWLTVRGDNKVLAFDVPTLIGANPNNSLIGSADSGGSAPVGLALFNQEQLLAVANSNRFTPNNPPGDPNITNISILDVRQPSSAKVVNALASGGLNYFPRNITVDPDGSTLYVTNFNIGTLQVIKTVTK